MVLSSKKLHLALLFAMIIGCAATTWHFVDASPKAKKSDGSPAPTVSVEVGTMQGATRVPVGGRASGRLSGYVTVSTGKVKDPSWTCGYTVQYASSAGDWTTAPEGEYTLALDGAMNTDQIHWTFRVSFSKAGYWRITNIYAMASCTSGSASGTVADLNFTCIGATISQSPILVAVGTTIAVTPTVIPGDESSWVSFSMADPSVARVHESGTSLLVTGVKAGTTQLRYKVAHHAPAEAATVEVIDIKFWPTSGPLLSEVHFKILTGTSFFSSHTTMSFDGQFIPREFGPIPLSFEQKPPRLKFHHARPDRLDMWIGGTLPTGFLASTSPAIIMGLTGTAKGTVTLKDGSKSCCLDVTYKITSAGTIGKIEQGVFKEVDEQTVWTVTKFSQITGARKDVFLYGQMVRPRNEFTADPPRKISGKLQSIYAADGTPLTNGVDIEFLLVSSSNSGHLYQTAKPFIFVNGSTFEGSYRHFAVVAGAEGCAAILRWQVP